MSLLLLLLPELPEEPTETATTYPGSGTFPGLTTFPGSGTTTPVDPEDPDTGGGTDTPPVTPTVTAPPFVASFRVEAPGLETLLLNAGSIQLLTVDLGQPEVRTVVDYAAGADGTIDATEMIGARVVTLQLHCNHASWAERQQLRAFTSPRLRPTLYFQLSEDAPEQQLTGVRISDWSDQMTTDFAYANQLPVMVQWVAPLGVLESAALHVNTVVASPTGAAEGGRTYSRTGNRVYAGGTVGGSGSGTLFTNLGTIDSYPLLRIYGPCVDPVVIQTTQNKRLAFTGLEILAGEFLEVDTRAKTIRYLGNPGDSRYDRLDFEESSWWTLSPGENRVRFAPLSSASPSNVEVSFRDNWL